MIIDASVGMKWLQKGEEHEDQAKVILLNHIQEKENIIVLPLFFQEVANSLVTKAGASQRVVTRSLKEIFSFNLIVYNPDKDDVVKAATLALKYKTTVYDMLYAVIAKSKKVKLITADERFKERTKFSFVVLLKDYKKRL